MPKIPATLFNGATATASHSLFTSNSEVLNASVIIPTECCIGADSESSNTISSATIAMRPMNTLRRRFFHFASPLSGSINQEMRTFTFQMQLE